MNMNVSDAIVRILEKEGITDAFGIPGAGINALYRSLSRSRQIRHATMRHEECCVHAAGGYYRASGRLAVALCTSGPGATNFTTGIYTCAIDSIPVVAITGQALRAQLGKDAFQCVDIAAICAPIAKKTYCVTDPEAVPAVLAEAFHTARSGKPGPVLIDLPLDVQMSECAFDEAAYRPLPVEKPRPPEAAIAEAMRLIEAAERPVMIMGGGVIESGATGACIAFAERMAMPVITTYMAKGGIAQDHPLHAGIAGIQCGQPTANRMLLEADLVLGIGCRFTDRHTGALDVYRGERRFIHINIEPREIGKLFPPTLGIVADAGLALHALLQAAGDAQREMPAHVRALPALRAELARKTDYVDVPIKPQRVFQAINDVFGDQTMFTTGCGITQIWSGQLQSVNTPRTYLPSGGAGCLGYDIPAAIGAMRAAPERKAVAVIGDFGFSFHMQELAVAVKVGTPVIVIIVNNAYLGLIRQNQRHAFGYEYAVEMAENQDEIDYVMVARGLGCAAERVFEPDALADAMRRALAADKPYVIDCVCDPRTDCSMGPSIDAVKEFV